MHLAVVIAAVTNAAMVIRSDTIVPPAAQIPMAVTALTIVAFNPNTATVMAPVAVMAVVAMTPIPADVITLVNFQNFSE